MYYCFKRGYNEVIGGKVVFFDFFVVYLWLVGI